MKACPRKLVNKFCKKTYAFIHENSYPRKLFLFHLIWLHISTTTIESKDAMSIRYIWIRKCKADLQPSLWGKRAMGWPPACTSPEAGINWWPPTALRPRRQNQETAKSGQTKEGKGQPQCPGPADTSETCSRLAVRYPISLTWPPLKYTPCLPIHKAQQADNQEEISQRPLKSNHA